MPVQIDWMQKPVQTGFRLAPEYTFPIPPQDAFEGYQALLKMGYAAEAGVDVRVHIGKDMIHTYPLDLWDYPEAMTAFEEIELFIRQQLR